MAGFGDSLRRLSEAQKPAKGASLYSRYINRPMGRVLAAAAYTVGLSPNAVTAASAFATALGLVLLVLLPVVWWSGVITSLLLVLGFALDSADGQVARLGGRGSPAGEWLDHVVDAGKMVAVHAAVLIGLWKSAGVPEAALLLPLAYMFVAVVLFSALTIYDLLARLGSRASTPTAPSTARAIALLPADFGVLALSFVFWGWTWVFLALYTALLICTTLITVALLVKWFRALQPR